MSTLRASEQGQKQIKQARKNKGWTVKSDDPRPLKEASKFLVQQHGSENEWDANDQRWLRDLNSLVRVETPQNINEIKIEIAKSPQGSLLERIEQLIDSGEIFAKDISYGSWSRFASQTKRHRIKERAFKAYCQVLGLEWQQIAENQTEQLSGTQQVNGKKPQTTAPNSLERLVYQNLPVRDHTKFIGRTTEITRLLELLSADSDVHQISAIGMGGMGKTALVLEAAYCCLQVSRGAEASLKAPGFEAIIFTSAQPQHLMGTGIWRRERGQQRNQREIFRAIARTLDCLDITYAALEDQREPIRESLGRQRTLLIVDNLETVEDRNTVLPFLRDLPPTVKVVVTTREHVPFVPIHLESLSETEALQLIAHQVAEKGIELNDAESGELYRKTSGVPAAIVYSIGQLAAGYFLEDVFWKLSQATSDIAHYCFSSSLEPLLGKPPHLLIMGLAMFPQPAQREAIAQVAGVSDRGAVMDGFARLQQLSLVKQQDKKLTMLPLTRGYAIALLETDPNFEQQARERWVNWYLEFASEQGSTNYQEWHDYTNLEREWENLTEVIEWCIDKERYDEFRKVWSSIKGFTRFHGYWDEHLSWMDWLIEAARKRQDLTTAAEAMCERAKILNLIDRPEKREEVIGLCSQALKLDDSDDLTFKFDAIINLIVPYINQQQFDKARDWIEQGQNLLQQASQEQSTSIRLQIYLLYYQARIGFDTGDYQQTKCFYDEALELAQKIDWQRGIIYIYGHLAELAISQKDLEEAERLLRLCLPEAKRNNDKRSIAFDQYLYACLERERGNLDEARRWAESAKENFDSLKMPLEVKKINALLQELLS